MNSNKGQITIFIIFGLVVSAAVLGLMYLGDRPVDEQVGAEELIVPLQFNYLEQFVDQCVQKTLEDGIYYTGLQGGYYEPPEESIYLFSNILEIPLYFYNGGSEIPPLSVFEEELDKYVEENIHANCNFSVFEKQGHQITLTGVPEAETKITNNGFVLELQYPLELKGENVYQEMRVFEARYLLNFKKILVAVTEIVADKKETGLVCLSCLNKLSEQHDLTFEEFYNLKTGTSYVSVFDEVEGKDYKFMFAMEDKGVTIFDEWENDI